MSRRGNGNGGGMGLSPQTIAAVVVGAILLLFALVNGMPWVTKSEYADLRTSIAQDQSTITALRERVTALETRATNFEGTAAKLEASVEAINRKLDRLLEVRGR